MALIHCPDCRSEMSDRARACLRCGAPNGTTAPVADSGSVCPFSGHALPGGETRCVCGAYYGYSNIAAAAHLRLGVVLGVAAPVLLLLALRARDDTATAWLGGAGILAVMFGLLYLLSAGVPMLRGKRWWQSF